MRTPVERVSQSSGTKKAVDTGELIRGADDSLRNGRTACYENLQIHSDARIRLSTILDYKAVEFLSVSTSAKRLCVALAAASCVV